MKDNQQTLIDNQKTLIDMLSKISGQLDTETKLRTTAEKAVADLRSQLTDLSKQLTTQATPPQTPPPGFPPLIPTAPPMPNLLIGTSLLRNVDSSKLNNWDVIAKGGASVDGLHKEINNLAEDKHYNEIIIVGGSIDLESKEVSDIVSDFQALTVSAAHKSEKIKISSVLPRTDKLMKEKTKKLNEDLRSMCSQDGFTFIDNDPMFHLLNGNVNEAFLVEDGLHLSKHGVNSLLHTCDVIKEGSAFTPTKYPKSPKPDTLLFRGHKHPLSNFFDVPITYNGKHFNTSEAAYQHAKAEAMGDHRAASKIIRSKTGLHAMKIAKSITTDDQWRQGKVKVMEAIIKEKLKSSDLVRNTLTQSGSKEIIEDTDHEFWGRGKTGQGRNQLGKIWIDFRKKCEESPNFLSGRPQHNRPVRQNRNWATRHQQPRCFNCGEAGHGIRQCRKQDTVSCWACGLAGHKQKHCGYFSRQTRSYYDDYDYDTSYDYDNNYNY
jgi:ribA/ribD-fused uncharacterized protein